MCPVSLSTAGVLVVKRFPNAGPPSPPRAPGKSKMRGELPSREEFGKQLGKTEAALRTQSPATC